MCDSSHEIHTADAAVASVPADLDAFAGERIPLAPVERVSITSLVDNVSDALAVDIGPAHRPTGESFPWVAAPMTVSGATVEVPRAEHGFSALVEIERAGGEAHRILFDAGVTPDGMV